MNITAEQLLPAGTIKSRQRGLSRECECECDSESCQRQAMNGWATGSFLAASSFIMSMALCHSAVPKLQSRGSLHDCALPHPRDGHMKALLNSSCDARPAVLLRWPMRHSADQMRFEQPRRAYGKCLAQETRQGQEQRLIVSAANTSH